jgi:uncharacterized membrane protein YphA (DoxX/SURF4 family)
MLETTLEKIRQTKNDKILSVIRISIGMIMGSTGIMKLTVPMLGNAWSGQLIQAGIPFYSFNLWFVPIVEIIIGTLLVAGFFSRLLSLVVISIMMAATYVHLIVADPSLFPLQPKEPVIPLVMIALSAYVLWRGGGAWSLDLKASQ